MGSFGKGGTQGATPILIVGSIFDNVYLEPIAVIRIVALEIVEKPLRGPVIVLVYHLETLRVRKFPAGIVVGT